MARKQAKRRKQKAAPRVRLPSIRPGRIVAPLFAIAVVAASYQLSLTLLDREITSIQISGPFQRVTALHIEEAIADQVDAGFIGADLRRIRERVIALPWIDQARGARRWPNRIAISVSEQVPAAVWGDSGLLNTRGELFVSEVRHVPAELPKLSGPEGSSAEVAAHYLKVREQLIPLGMDLQRVHLDARGSWQMTLQNGIEVRLGRRDVAARTDLFLGVVVNLVTARQQDVDYVDMRYGNGFTIGWKTDAEKPGNEADHAEREMLAARGTE